MLMTLVLLNLSGITSAVFAEPPDDVKAVTPVDAKALAPSAAATGATKGTTPVPVQPPPAAPREYLNAGAKLFNKGRYELATKYIAAARMYRDGLSESERVVLDVYEEKLDEYRREMANAQAPVITVLAPANAETGGQVSNPPGGMDPSVITTSVHANPTADVVRDPAVPQDWVIDPAITAMPDTPQTPTEPQSVPASAPRLGMESGPVYGSATWRDSGTDKEKARWLLKLAREQIFKEHFDVAEKAIAEARDMGVKWTIFDETPEKMSETMGKAKAKKAKELAAGPGGPHDRRAAKLRLRNSRAAIARGDLEEAEKIAREVNAWGISYGLLDDTPAKIAATIADAKRRLAVRNTELTVKSYASERSALDQKAGPGFTDPEPKSPTRPN